MAHETVHTLIIGGGQAGLTMSHCLRHLGIQHLVVERHRIAERWHSERWDGLRFQFPNWSVRLPDFQFLSTMANEFASRSEIADFIEAYATFVDAPVRCGVEVTALRPGPGETPAFRAETASGPIDAANVVLATGPYQRPFVPDLAPGAGVLELHSSAYRNPAQLPAGSVLVVGAGASGAQIAEELMHAGRAVHLAVGAHRRVPRRYRGRDIIWWLNALGTDETPAEKRGTDQSPLVISGAMGGRTIDFRRFAADGIVLHGRAQSICDGVMRFADDLDANLDRGDAAYDAFIRAADIHAERHGLELPLDEDARSTLHSRFRPTGSLRDLNLVAAGITTIIWATGYRFDLGWVHLPVLGPSGAPRHSRGVSAVPGLFFLGLPWLSKAKSAFLSGVGDDAAYLANQIAART